MRRPRPPHSVRGILVAFALVLIVPALVAAGGLVAWNVAEAKAAKERQLLDAAKMVSSAVDLRVAQLLTMGDALAGSDSVRQSDWPRLVRKFRQFDLGDQAWLAVTDRRGRRLLNTFDGVSVSAGQGLPRPSDVTAAVTSGRPTISDLFQGATSGRHVVSVNAATSDDPEERVVTLVLNPKAFTELLRTFPVESGGMLTVVDGNRRVLARTVEHDRFLGELATPSMRRAMDSAATGVVPSVSLDGRPTVVAYARSSLTGWTTMVVTPRAALTRPVAATAAAVAGLALLLLLLGIGVANRLGRLLTRELTMLEQDAVSIGHGAAVSPRTGPITQVNTVQGALSLAGLELMRRDDRQKLMIHELNHRVKNTLATVQALAAQTFRDPGTDATARFDKRLQAFAGAHDLLTQMEWREVDVRDIAGRCATQSGEDRILVSGPSVTLRPHAALALCMVLHELSTNSLKYGALSAPEGRVSLGWSKIDDRFEIKWSEVGGPPPRQPTRTGFGTRLMDRLAKTELGGEIARAYEPTGLVVTGNFSLESGARWRSDFD